MFEITSNKSIDIYDIGKALFTYGKSEGLIKVLEGFLTSRLCSKVIQLDYTSNFIKLGLYKLDIKDITEHRRSSVIRRHFKRTVIIKNTGGQKLKNRYI
ncbi:hypothetical protein [uncultured Psychromonas sp.]|uniref:hypothetical protein n=1 Tax=uncultured Psychromonas sp. TaxID=173974 RepID=UPI00262BC69F|nr:hypothetical protein [uncultured Psychromonas sp.]